MSSRADILQAIRRTTPPPAELPARFALGVAYDDPHAQFEATLLSVGGQAIRVTDTGALIRELAALDVYRQAKRIFSKLPGIPRANVDLDAIDDPRELNGLDLAILPGEFAVAENAAVWVACDALRQRAVHVAAEHLVLVVPAAEIVHNMHQAYERLKFDGPSYRLFLSGPSKTADIEQSLVIGAQGPRSLTVFLIG